MDPYIESSDRWGSFHVGMVVAISAQLNTRLPERFVASVAEYVLVEEPAGSGKRRAREPDVYVSKRASGSGSTAAIAVAPASATIVLPEVLPRRRRYVQVYDREMHQVVTVLELLSPANKKAGDDRDAYLRKRKEYRASGLTLVEIDLLRGGRRLPLSTPPPEIQDYYIMVCRSWDHPRADFWTLGVRDPLPPIPVPLTEEENAVPLDLRASLDRVYDESRYASELHYDEPLTPKLGKRDAGWVAEVLGARSRR
ncbi:hypothetical protein AYO40_02140 [Planctomycetaceae bacterium SCGC AG-212-D15]|nr:hypothetical protein AYO40_02140 [Planctomycetaceae bacterium SCGC AG-212-D15]